MIQPIYMKYLISIILLIISNAIQSQCNVINAGNDITLDCNNCQTLTANYTQTRATNAYLITPIPYNPLPYTTGTIYNIAVDDRWSNVVTLPFEFCFFNQTYTQYVIGTNGIISFNTSYAGLYCPWAFSVPIPNNNPNPPPGFPRSMIGLYHDIDPSLGGEVRYGVTGVYPCRKLVISFNDVPHFNCPIQRSKFQIILFELSNIIEIHVERKQTCGSWNGGRACLGIQNAAGSIAYAPTGRNTANYTINTPEAWRFSPNGVVNSVFSWLNSGGNIIGTNSQLVVCNPNSYIAEVKYNCGSNTIEYYDTVNVGINTYNLPIIHSD